MAYGRYSKYRRRTARPRSRRYRRSTTTYRTSRNPYRFKKYRRTKMSKRRVLNITSTKKHDNMQSVSFNADGSAPANRGYILAGDQLYQFIWNATARDRDTTNTDQNAVNVRTADTVFLRGLKETISLSNYQNSSNGYAAAWRWRRIVFTAKGLYQALAGSADYAYTSNGYVRMIANQANTTFGTTVQSLIFQGVAGQDWGDVFTAKTDHTRVTIRYDRTVTLTPPSNAKKFWNFKMWHGINKNLVYSNEESGGSSETLGVRSTIGKPGVGDVYVVDYLQCAQNTAEDTLIFEPQATLYWHEK